MDNISGILSGTDVVVAGGHSFCVSFQAV
jgi:hypothetical protein